MGERTPAVQAGRVLEIEGHEGVVMELLVEKLKLLGYEAGWCRKKKPYKKPISRTYFAYPAPEKNQGDAFTNFYTLSAWLLGLVGQDIGKADDPVSACSSLLQACQALGFARPSYSAAKLTNGWGREVIGILDALADFCLESTGFQFRKPVRGGPEGDDDEQAGNDESILGTDIGEELEHPVDDTEYQDAGAGRGAMAAGDIESEKPAEEEEDEEHAVLESTIDPAEWKLELARVAPHLRLVLAASSKDWKSHLEEARKHYDAIATRWPESDGVLGKLRTDVGSQLEKLETREKLLNEQYDNLGHEYRLARGRLEQVEEELQGKLTSADDKKSELQSIVEQLEDMLRVVKDSTCKVSDSTPVVRMKGAIKKMGEELAEMEIKIGVARHALLNVSLKARDGGNGEYDDDEDYGY